MKSPLQWIGGKSRMASELINLFPPHKTYCEVFSGGASVFFNKAPSKIEMINDINKELINFYRVVQYHPEALIAYVLKMPVSKEEFHRIRKISPDYLTDIQRATHFFYLNRLGFGGRLNEPSFSAGHASYHPLETEKVSTRIKEAARRLQPLTVIECLPYSDIINRYETKETFFLFRSALLWVRGLLRQKDLL